MNPRRLLLILGMILCGAADARAADEIWTGVLVARNTAKSDSAPEEVRDLLPRMKRVFGYNHFELLGSASNKIQERTESWLVPCQTFKVGVRARRALSKEAQGGYLVTLQLVQKEQPIVETEAKLAPGSPLFIRGPQWGKGQLIIMVQVKR